MRAHHYSRALASTALAYAVLHHLGLLPSGLGSAPDGTQWADWLDLLVPWLVLAPAALTLRPGPVGYLLAVAVGLTWASNAVGGGTVVMSLVLAGVASAYGWTRRRELGVVLLAAGAPAVAVLVVELSRGTT